MKEVHVKFEWCFQGHRWGWEKEALRLLVNLTFFVFFFCPLMRVLAGTLKTLTSGRGGGSPDILATVAGRSVGTAAEWKSKLNKCWRNLRTHKMEQVNWEETFANIDLLFVSKMRCHMSAFGTDTSAKWLTHGRYGNVHLGQWVKRKTWDSHKQARAQIKLVYDTRSAETCPILDETK